MREWLRSYVFAPIRVIRGKILLRSDDQPQKQQTGDQRPDEHDGRGGVVLLDRLVADLLERLKAEQPHGDEDEPSGDLELSITGVEATRDEDGTFRVLLHTSRGDIPCLFTACEGEPGVVLFAGGALGGFDGPAGGLYGRLAAALQPKGLSSLRVNYRQPGEFEECVLDLLGALSFLKGLGAGRVALVGHSFGGAVVIKAGELSPAVEAVVALSSQRYGTSTVENLSPRPLLLAHGADDMVLLPAASEDIFERAQEPKRLVIFPGAGHSLVECREELDEMLETFLVGVVGSGTND